MKAKLSSGALRFKVPHAAENSALAAFRSGEMRHLLPPEATVADARVAPSEGAAAEVTIIVDLRCKN